MSSFRRILVQDGIRHGESEGHVTGMNWTISWKSLHGGLSEGVRVVTLSNGSFSVTVCPTRGMGVLRAEADGTFIGWHSPVVGPVHPQYVNLKSRNSLGWLDGFSELLCRCGLSSFGPPGVDDGAASPIESDLTLHGRVANIPAHSVEIGCDETTGCIWISGDCRESTLFGPHLVLRSRLTVPLDGASFRVDDAVTNYASAETELQLLYHINVGPPFLEAGARFETACRTVAPRDDRAAEGIQTYAEYLGPTAGYAEQVYFFDALADGDGQSTALLRNRSGNLGVSVSYDRSQLPCLSQWKCTQPAPDGYVTGIEPGTGFPNFKSQERQQGRVIRLSSGETYHAGLTLSAHIGSDAVDSVFNAIRALQSGVSPTVHSRSADCQILA